MWQRNGWILVLGLGAACLDVVNDPATQTGSGAVASTRRGGEHFWVFHIAGGRYAEHIQLVAIGDQADRTGLPVFRPLWSRAWDGFSVNDFEDVKAIAVQALAQPKDTSADVGAPGGPGSSVTVLGDSRPVDTLNLSWTLLDVRSGQNLYLTYAVVADTAVGTFTLSDGTSYPMFGVRFDSSAINLVAPTPLAGTQTSVPAVLIRLDDAAASDRDFLQRLKTRGLTAELAVPTRFLGLQDRLTLEDLRDWSSAGMGIVMHSRYHLSTGADAQHFIGETVGGFAEMAAYGFPSHVFVQPGTWRDSIYFDSPAKLHTWRGALLRTFATVSECYAYRIWLSAPADSFRLGLAHATISDGVSDDWIRSAWRVALRPGYATAFLVHTRHLKTPDQLDWFLDLVADAKMRGVARVVANSEELFQSP